MPKPKKPRVGRPPLPKGEAREVLTVRCSPVTRAKLVAEAERQGTNLGRVVDHLAKGLNP